MKLSRIFLILSGLASIMFAVEVRFTSPPETGEFKAGPGVDAVQASCLTCHSSEYVTTQPPMPRAFWEATVKKMVDRFAAPLDPQQVPAIVDYLTTTYGPQEKRAP